MGGPTCPISQMAGWSCDHAPASTRPRRGCRPACLEVSELPWVPGEQTRSELQADGSWARPRVSPFVLSSPVVLSTCYQPHSAAAPAMQVLHGLGDARSRIILTASLSSIAAGSGSGRLVTWTSPRGAELAKIRTLILRDACKLRQIPAPGRNGRLPVLRDSRGVSPSSRGPWRVSEGSSGGVSASWSSFAEGSWDCLLPSTVPLLTHQSLCF